MTGRCWSSAGGTLNYSGTGPGPYYVEAVPPVHLVGTYPGDDPGTVDRAVRFGVKAIQRALNRQLGGEPLRCDGLFGVDTGTAVCRFQRRRSLAVDGVVGRDTAKLLFTPVCERLANDRVPACLLVGLVANESAFDPGAVGFVDEADKGLVQINSRWHPEFSEPEQFAPIVAVDYAVGLYEAALRALDGNLEDAVASYNLGIGGARTWIEHGRPDVIDYYASGPVHVRDYIDRILSGCGRTGRSKT